jgi:hypothetical protein
MRFTVHSSEYYEEQSRVGHCHPFILETLADYTEDESLAMSYYKKALGSSQGDGRAVSFDSDCHWTKAS